MMNSQPVYVSNHTNHAFLSVALSMLSNVKYFTLDPLPLSVVTGLVSYVATLSWQIGSPY